MVQRHKRRRTRFVRARRYLEGCGDVTAALAHVRRRLPDVAPTRVLVTAGGGRAALLEAPDGGALDLEDVLAGHVAPALEELKAANPRCSLTRGHKKGKAPAPPLTATPPRFPALRLDDAIPSAFVGFAGLGEAFVTAAATDPEFLPTLAGADDVAQLAGYDDGDAPKPCQGMPDAVLVFFSGLHAAKPELPRLYAHVLGGCKNNFVAAAVARKALFYALEAEEHYVSPVAAGEALLNSRGAAVDTAALFAELTLEEAAALDEREVERRFGKIPEAEDPLD